MLHHTVDNGYSFQGVLVCHGTLINFVLCLSLGIQGVLFSSLCLERNLPDMMHLWSEIFNK